MVLHRPVESTAFTGHWAATGNPFRPSADRRNGWAAGGGAFRWLRKWHWHSRPLLSVFILLDKTNHQRAELRGLFEIHNVPHVFDDHTARPRHFRFDCAGVRMNVRDIGIPTSTSVGT